MKIQQTTVIDGVEVVDSGDKIMGHRIFECVHDDDSNTKYIVDGKGDVKSIIKIYADCSQNSGYVSGFEVSDVK